MSPSKTDILIEHCRFFPRHADRAEALLKTHGDAWSADRDRLIGATQTMPRGGMVFLLGEMGRGKTQMCACMALAQLGQKDRFTPRINSARYIRAHEMLMGFRDAQKTGREVQTLREFASPRLLFIDDVHELQGTDHEQRSLVAVLDERLQYMRWTVLIANRDRATLGDIIDKAIAHRAQEGKLVIEVKGRNYREGGRQ